MLYNVLKSKLHPAFDKYGERELAEGKAAYRVEWVIVGKATSIEDAKRRGFVAPVLERR